MTEMDTRMRWWGSLTRAMTHSCAARAPGLLDCDRHSMLRDVLALVDDLRDVVAGLDRAAPRAVERESILNGRASRRGSRASWARCLL